MSEVIAKEPLMEGSSDVLIGLDGCRDSFRYLEHFIGHHQLNPAVIPMPQTVQKLDQLVSTDSQLKVECYSFLDTVRLLSFTTYGNPDKFVDAICLLASRNRTPLDSTMILNPEADRHYVYDSIEDLEVLFKSNPWLLALYIYSLFLILFPTVQE